MHSGQLEKAGSLRRRTLSRGMSEEESLRHIIREAEESSRHLTRSDSRFGTLRRGQGEESQSEDDLLSESLEMTQLSYEECVAELRVLSLQQEALFFQVDVLQDALEGTEEMLSETQRETHQLTLELERERAVRRKTEDRLAAVTQEMERLREERAVEQKCRPAPEGSSVDRDETPLPASGGAAVHLNTPVAHLKNRIRQSLGLSVCEDQQTPGVCVDQRAPEVCEDLQTPEVCEDLLTREVCEDQQTPGVCVDQRAPEVCVDLQTHTVCEDLQTPEVCEDLQTPAVCVDLQTPEAQDENEESSGYEDAPSEFSPTADTPDEESDGNIPARIRNDDSCTLS